MINATIDMEATLQWLDHGDIKMLAKKADITTRQAQNILKGKSKNLWFITKVVEKAEDNMRLAQRTQLLRENLKLIA